MTCALVATRNRVNKNLLAVLGLIAALAILAGGIIAAAVGPHEGGEKKEGSAPALVVDQHTAPRGVR